MMIIPPFSHPIILFTQIYPGLKTLKISAFNYLQELIILATPVTQGFHS
jgi:hypothetical protein